MKNQASYNFELPEHYDLFGTMRFGRFGQWDPTQTLSNDRFVKVTHFDGAITVIDATRDKTRLSVDVISAGTLFDRQTIEALFGLHRAPLRVTGHPTLERLSRKLPGLHLGVSVSLGYDLIRTVFQQLIEWRDAAKIWRQWVLKFGSQVAPNGLYCPPSFEDIQRHPLGHLQACGLSLKRAAVVRELARLGNRLDGWVGDDETSLSRRLRTIPGIGNWTIEHCLGFSTNTPDVVITGDYQLPHTVAWVLANEERADDARMFDLLAPWRGQRWYVQRIIFGSDIRAPRRGPRLNRGRPLRPR
ncbi:MAG: hypothetical protein VYA30_01970 [Myxococcota bacterium]|nr:hypothetical protein [Myxococcota bacterium]